MTTEKITAIFEFVDKDIDVLYVNSRNEVFTKKTYALDSDKKENIKEIKRPGKTVETVKTVKKGKTN